MQMMIWLTLILSASVAVADTTQLRSALRTAPDMATEVSKDAQQNVQIHDSFASMAAADVEVEKRIESNRELQALLQIDASQLRSTGRTAPDMAGEVSREAQQNIHIHDGFASMASADVEAEKHVKANRELQALLQIDTSRLRSIGRTAPDMATEVAREGKDNIQIHDGFASMAASDVEVEKHIEANRELQALLQVDRRQLRSVARTEVKVPGYQKEKEVRPIGEGAHQDPKAVKQRTKEKNMDCEEGNWNDCHGPGGDYTNATHFPKPPKKSGAASVASSIGLTLTIIFAAVQ